MKKVCEVRNSWMRERRGKSKNWKRENESELEAITWTSPKRVDFHFKLGLILEGSSVVEVGTPMRHELG